ncbi:MAG: HypC/HybG/HupF family hydrogenase formation chaperone [Anaerolineales bacterium]
MCLAIPVQIKAIDSAGQATVELGGVERQVSLVMTPEAKVGDYVLVHTGFALNVLDEQEAQATLALFAELDAFEEQYRASEEQ